MQDYLKPDVAGGALGFDRGETGQSIPDRFAKVAARFGDRPAVVARDARLTYGQLDAASADIARRLLDRLGEGAEPVCMLLGQGAALVAAILGTLKAGKIYLALDPRHPRAELRHFVEHSGARLILSDAAHGDLAGALADGVGEVLTLGALAMEGADPAPRLALPPERPAYIFYTSGSTGAPKGVFDSHRNVLHNVMRYTAGLRIGPEDRLSMIQSCSFSGTVSSLFGALMNGAAVHPFDLQGAGVKAMAAWLERDEITIYHSVPAIFEQLAAMVPPLPHLRCIRLEGDRSEPRHLRMFQERFGREVVLANGLGATETGLVRQFFFRAGDTVPGAVVPIGHPVPDKDVRVIDDEGRAVRPGEIGEIAVASRYLALGYWRRPELTAEAFRPDPADPGRRIYRTGDLGRIDPDGCLDYVGRKDLQAKLRGTRVDLPAIEAVLNRQTGVDRAIVSVREDRPGVQRLVAYLTADGTGVEISGLRRALAGALPAAMVPARYVVLDAWPLDRNGKLDRRALPPPGAARPELAAPFVAPATARQRALADCFAEVLGLDAVGLDDDFFELGGDSLLATELLLLIDQRLDLLCPSDFLYTATTIAEIERTLDGAARAGDLVALAAAGSGPALFCLHSTSGHVLEYRELASLVGADRPVYGVQRRELMAGDAALPRPDDMAGAAVAEILRVQPEGPYHLCGNCFGGIVAVEAARQLEAAGHDVGLIALIETRFHADLVSAFAPPRPVGDYWVELAGLAGAERVGYTLRRLSNHLGRIVRGAAAYGRFLAARTGAAQAPYRLVPPAGPVTLYVPGGLAVDARWRALLPRMEVVQVGDGFDVAHQPHLVNEPYVGVLAGLLRRHLAERTGGG